MKKKIDIYLLCLITSIIIYLFNFQKNYCISIPTYLKKVVFTNYLVDVLEVGVEDLEDSDSDWELAFCVSSIV